MFLRTGPAPKDLPEICKSCLVAQEPGKFLDHLCLILELTFPDNERAPAHVCELTPIRTVTLAILLEFRNPVLLSCIWYSSFCAALVLMPETSMDKDRFASARKHDIWTARKTVGVQTVAIAHTVQQRPHGHFRSSVLASYPRHVSAAIFLRKPIHSPLDCEIERKVRDILEPPALHHDIQGF